MRRWPPWRKVLAGVCPLSANCCFLLLIELVLAYLQTQSLWADTKRNILLIASSPLKCTTASLMVELKLKNHWMHFVCRDAWESQELYYCHIKSLYRWLYENFSMHHSKVLINLLCYILFQFKSMTSFVLKKYWTKKRQKVLTYYFVLS